ncbi:MAG: class I SAM-dependent methyltransferase [Bacteroidales bacterium]
MKLIKSIFKLIFPKFYYLILEYKVDLKPRYGHGKGPHQFLQSIINKHIYIYILYDILKNKEIFFNISKIPDKTNMFEPYWQNGFFPGLDIVSLYTILQKYNPRKFIEIGSGNSTMVARKSIKDNNLRTQIISIDPYPRASIDDISDLVVREPIEVFLNYDFIEELEENDVLFIDNSHRCLPNSDVTVCFLDIIPRLKKGVIIHIHDIYIPYDYPPFMCKRLYSEQYLLSTLLLYSSETYQIILPNYFISENTELSQILTPLWDHPNLEGVEKHGCSFWFQKVR